MISLLRSAKLQNVGVEPPTGVDGQGKPSYGPSVTILARVVRGDNVMRLGNGEEIKTIATVWVDINQVPLPTTDARLTCDDGLVGIVVERTEGRTLQAGTLDHVRVRIREE